MNQDDFDRAGRYTAKMDGTAFLLALYGSSCDGAVEFWTDTRTNAGTAQPPRTGDLVLVFRTAFGRRAAVVEMQTIPSGEILHRLLELLARHARELRPQGILAVPALVSLSGAPSELELRANLGATDTDGLWMRPRHWILRDELASDWLERIAAGAFGVGSCCVLPWVVLMRGSDEPANTAHWLRLALSEPNELRRADLGALAGVFVKILGVRRESRWRQALRGYNMLRSEFLDEIRDKARDEGREEMLAESVLQVLRDRFPRVTAKLCQAIAAIKDSAQLRGLLTQAATAVSLAEFRQQSGLRLGGRKPLRGRRGFVVSLPILTTSEQNQPEPPRPRRSTSEKSSFFSSLGDLVG
jgi:hypothetical protein